MFISDGFLVVNDNDQTKIQWRWIQGPNMMFLHHDAKYLPWLYKSREVGLKMLEQKHDGTNKMTDAPSKDSDQPGHSSSLIKDFAVHFLGS